MLADGTHNGSASVPNSHGGPADRRANFVIHMQPDARNRLAGILKSQEAEIRSGWRSALQNTPTHRYSTLATDELDTSLGVLFDGFVEYLGSGNPDTLGGLVSAVARVRFGQGFPLTEVEAAVGAMRAVVVPLVIRAMASEPERLVEAMVAIMTGEELASARVAEVYQEVTTSTIQAAHDEALRAEREKVAFCREMARVATHDKLILCDHTDIPARPDTGPVAVSTPTEVRSARHQAAALARAAGWENDRSYALQLCIGEAGTNAVRHAGAATFQVWMDPDGAITFRLADAGPGIDLCRLPSALRSGYSTGSSLGMGFTLMLELADRIHLATDQRGTTLQLTVCRD